jgi:integrase
VQIQLDIMKLYESSFKSKKSAISYLYHLKKYCNNNVASLTKLSQKEAEDRLIQFIVANKEAGMHWGALHNYVAAVAKFYLINDSPLNLKRVNRFMPECTKLVKDRSYTREEIQSLLDISNERTKAVILLLASTGMRIGGICPLRRADLEDKGNIYKITVYSNTRQEYFSYCTPECKKALDIYFQIRQRHGEIFSDKSPVIREQYNIRNYLSVKYPRYTTIASIEFILKEVEERAGIRTRIKRTENQIGIARKDVMLAHGFRKFFNTQLVSARINPLIKEMLMGHHIGLEESYYRPMEEDIQTEYEKSIPFLTIDPNQRLKKELVDERRKITKLEALLDRIDMLELKLNERDHVSP